MVVGGLVVLGGGALIFQGFDLDGLLPQLICERSNLVIIVSSVTL